PLVASLRFAALLLLDKESPKGDTAPGRPVRMLLASLVAPAGHRFARGSARGPRTPGHPPGHALCKEFTEVRRSCLLAPSRGLRRREAAPLRGDPRPPASLLRRLRRTAPRRAASAA